MQIPSLIASAALIASKVAKSHEASPTRSADSAQDMVAERGTPAASEMSVSLTGSSKNAKSQGAPGMSMNQLNSMLQTSLRMQSIRNDASIPAEVKKKLLAPLQQANAEALDVANTKAEQEEKQEIIEASNEDAKAIRKAGEAIAASSEEKEAQPASPLEPTDVGTYEMADTTATSSMMPVPSHAPAPEALSPVYSAPSADATVGKSVDVQA